MKYSGGIFLLIPRLTQKIIRESRSLLNTTIYSFSVKSFGDRSKISANVYIDSPKSVSIGTECYVGISTKILSEFDNANLELKNKVKINEGCLVDYTGGLIIGENVVISEGAIIYTHDHGIDPNSTPRPVAKQIQQNAWIGVRAVLMPACNTIGENAIIGACSVVTKNVEPYTIVAGNPARKIGDVPR